MNQKKKKECENFMQFTAFCLLLHAGRSPHTSAAGPDYSWPHTGLLCMARLKDDTHKSEKQLG
jgi:hypothetical protein